MKEQLISLAEKEGFISKRREELLNYESEDSLSININLRGSYEDLIKYLQKIKGINYYNDIVSVRLEKFSESQEVSVGALYERRFLPINQGADSEDIDEEPIEIETGVKTDLEVIFYLKNE